MGQHNSRGGARIISQKEVARGYREIRLEYLDGAGPDRIPEPGSFFTFLPAGHPLQTMRRPFAYSAADEKGFSFIYEIRGDATSDLAERPDGAVLDWIGPLGRSFPMPQNRRRPVLVAGGIGIGPMYYLTCRLSADSGSGGEPLVIVGARTAALVPELEWPDGAEVVITTDDGTRGRPGTVLSALEAEVSEGGLSRAEFYSCGPHPMMAAVHRLALATGAPCWTSMEEMMACGVGACQGCAVELAEQGADGGAAYQRACVEGPVFSSRELAW